MKAAFVLVKCELGRLGEVASTLVEMEGVSEVHSITGAFDLLVKLYAPEYDDFGSVVPDQVQKVPGVRDTTTLLAFRAFKTAP
ncbi:MAG TPA: Lrp/AsnC ligand binding domain-containing protein [Anaeromyxobacter sp.]